MKKLAPLIILLATYFNTLSAQSGEPLIEQKIPTLNGHRFLSSSYLKSSFIATSFLTDVAFGTTSKLTIPGISIEDYEILNFTGRLLFLDLNTQYQQRFTDWFSLFLTLKMGARVGGNVSTIMVDGVNSLSGMDIGCLVRIKHSKKLNLTTSLKVNNVRGNFINVSGYFEDIINNNPNPSVIKNVPAMTAVMGLRGAYAFDPSFGLQFMVDYSYGESLERGEAQSSFSGGIMGDINFNPKHEVPVGLAIGYTLSSVSEVVLNEGGFSNLFIGKIAYTGSNDYELGLQFAYYDVKLKSVGEKPFVKKVAMVIKFYF